MFRLMFLAFHGEGPAAPSEGHEHARVEESHGVEHGPAHEVHEPSLGITVPLVILAVLSLVGGLIGLPAYLGPNYLESYLEPSFQYRLAPHAAEHGSHALEIALTIVTSLVALGGMSLAYLAYVRDRELPARVASRVYGLYRAARTEILRRRDLRRVHRTPDRAALEPHPLAAD